LVRWRVSVRGLSAPRHKTKTRNRLHFCVPCQS
jgi:hypothetical protein